MVSRRDRGSTVVCHCQGTCNKVIEADLNVNKNEQKTNFSDFSVLSLCDIEVLTNFKQKYEKSKCSFLAGLLLLPPPTPHSCSSVLQQCRLLSRWSCHWDPVLLLTHVRIHIVRRTVVRYVRYGTVQLSTQVYQTRACQHIKYTQACTKPGPHNKGAALCWSTRHMMRKASGRNLGLHTSYSIINEWRSQRKLCRGNYGYI